MRLKLAVQPRSRGSRLAYTVIEAVMAMGVAAVIFAALFAGFFSGFAIIQVNRENLRAGQILLEKTEMIRLYNWNQINNGWCGNPYTSSNSSVPASFIARYYESAGNGGLYYTGTVSIVSAPLSETYSSDVRQVTVRLNWTSSRVPHTRSMTTYVSRYGLQNYIY